MGWSEVDLLFVHPLLLQEPLRPLYLRGRGVHGPVLLVYSLVGKGALGYRIPHLQVPEGVRHHLLHSRGRQCWNCL